LDSASVEFIDANAGGPGHGDQTHRRRRHGSVFGGLRHVVRKGRIAILCEPAMTAQASALGLGATTGIRFAFFLEILGPPVLGGPAV
jgi:hypothetical protein